MKFEKTLFKVSVKETIIFSIFLFVLLNGIIFLFSLVIGKPGFLLYDTAWILQIVFPFVYSIMQTSINRNGVLKITDHDDSATLMQKIEPLILKKGYIAENSEEKDITYVKKTKWGRFFNYFFRENIRVQINENEVLIFSKRNLLLPVLMRLKYHKADR